MALVWGAEMHEMSILTLNDAIQLTEVLSGQRKKSRTRANQKCHKTLFGALKAC